MRAEDVHGHSVNRLGVARGEGASLLVLHTSLSNSSLDCGAVLRLLGWKTLMEDSSKDALLPMRGGAGSLFSQGQGVPPYLCCRRPWLPSGCLTP